MADAPKYTDEDVRAIVERALGTQGGTSLTHSDLLAIGEGVGLSASAMENAAHEVAEARLNDEAKKGVTSRRKRGLVVHGAVFALVNALLFAVNLLTTPGEWWVLFSVFVWGLGLALHAGLSLGAGVSARRLRRERQRLEDQRRVKAKPQLRVGTTAPTDVTRVTDEAITELEERDTDATAAPDKAVR